MADITEEMRAIESAYKGKEIKEAIVSALDKVNTNEGTTRFLDGHGESEFLTQEELDSILPLDDEPTKDSGKAMSSNKIYTYLDKLNGAIDKVNGTEGSSGSSESIKEKLEYLNETKRAIRKELIDKGIPVDPDNDPFDSYADKIGQIELKANLDVQPLEITENGTYEADEGTAYNPVTTNVTFNLTSKTITKNGIYKAESERWDGYSEVDVSASDALTTKTISDDDFPKEIEPIELKASDEGDDIIGYSEITIDLTEKVMEKDPVVLDPEETGEEYVYDAKDDDVYGYSKFTVSIKDTSTKFTVKFMSDGDVVYEDDNVPKGGYCSYKGPTLTKEGYVFSGWNPQPINVERNLICVAKWVEDEKAQKDAGGSSGGGQTIDKMNWADVMAHPDYINQGDTKTLYWAPFEWNGHQFKGGVARAHCIWKGEQGTNTTWCIELNMADLIDNIDVNNVEDLYIDMMVDGNHDGTSGSKDLATVSLSYEKMPFIDFASSLGNAIKSCTGEGYEGQNGLTFVSVTKKTQCLVGGVFRNKVHQLDGIWLFSGYEMTGSGYEGNYEDKTGIIKYPYFTTLRCPTRSVADMNYIKATEYMHKLDNTVEVNETLAYEISFGGVPNGPSSTATNRTGDAIAYYRPNVNEALQRYAGFATSCWSGIRHVGEQGRLGIGYLPSGSFAFGFCL